MNDPAVTSQASGEPKPVKEKQERVRSAIDFPYNSLDDAVAVVKAVHKLGGNQCRLESLAAELGHDTVNSGGFRQKVASAKTFGLSSLSQGVVTLTPLGGKIVDADQERASRVEAFLTVPLYKAIYEEFKTGALPPFSGLEAKMVTLGVPDKQKDKARQVFQRSAKEAGFFAYGTSKLVYPALGASKTTAVRPADDDDDQESQKGSNGGNGGGDGNGGGGKKRHPFIEGLLETLPPAALGIAKTQWSLKERQDWLQTAAGIFNLIYTAKDDDRGTVTVSVAAPKDGSAN
jgi:hypothetical protein